VSLPNFGKQSDWLILRTDLDTAIGKYSGNNEHKNFYVENLVPNQGKKPRPTTRRIFTLHYHGQIGYEVTHPSNSHTNVQHLLTLTHVLATPRPGQITYSQKNEFFSLLQRF